MLTKDDFSSIKKIIREEIGNEVKDAVSTLESKIIISLMQTQSSIGDLEDRIKNLAIKLDGVDKNVKENKKNIGKLQKTLDVAIKMFNEDDVKLEKRVRKIETHLRLPSKN